MYPIKEEIEKIKKSLPADVALVAVSKYHSCQAIFEAYDAGQRVFGESHAQELAKKAEALPTDIQWHFIGHLQRNKVRIVVPVVSLIESVDSVRLMREINKEGERCLKTINILLEIHIAKEESKSGFSMAECREMLAAKEWKDMKNIRICGVMAIATNTDDEEQICEEFMQASQFFDEIKKEYFADASYFKEKSWGMSDDYLIATKCHSSMVRIGTKIFGPRQY